MEIQQYDYACLTCRGPAFGEDHMQPCHACRNGIRSMFDCGRCDTPVRTVIDSNNLCNDCGIELCANCILCGICFRKSITIPQLSEKLERADNKVEQLKKQLEKARKEQRFLSEEKSKLDNKFEFQNLSFASFSTITMSDNLQHSYHNGIHYAISGEMCTSMGGMSLNDSSNVFR